MRGSRLQRAWTESDTHHPVASVPKLLLRLLHIPHVPRVPPGTGLPFALVPDLAYFDAAAASSGSLVDSPDGSNVAGLRDVLRPAAQLLAWRGDCRYDATAGGGAVALDGGSCHAMLDTRLCGDWDIKLSRGYVNVRRARGIQAAVEICLSWAWCC